LATWSNTTSRPPRTRKNGHEHSSPRISPRHLPPRETGVRVDPLVASDLPRMSVRAMISLVPSRISSVTFASLLPARSDD
jgi:hypothetical protein